MSAGGCNVKMGRANEVAELRLALVAVLQALADQTGEAACANVLNAAGVRAGRTSREVLGELGASKTAATAARFGAVRTLSSLCGACRRCPRGEPALASVELTT